MHTDLLGDGLARRWFTAVKYLTYSLLSVNIFLFLREELAALEHTFSGSMELSQFIQVFATTTDTAAWVVLLLLFELETSVLEDAQIRGWVKRSLHGLRLVCSAAIVWAFTGYCAELMTLYATSPLVAWDACGASGEWSLLVTLDQYVPLTSANCGPLQAAAVQIDGFSIASTPEVLRSVRYLAWTDVINAAAWILVVIVLEIEVRLQLRGRLTDAVVDSTRYLKYVLYSTLLLAAAYWGFAGDFLDFWDACLWLFAFVFIELNVFDWQRETHLQT
ncbi:MAG: hypothetical protein ACI87W_003027 [Halieaceae bacterium]|jgi:hypothetical protein